MDGFLKCSKMELEDFDEEFRRLNAELKYRLQMTSKSTPQQKRKWSGKKRESLPKPIEKHASGPKTRAPSSIPITCIEGPMTVTKVTPKQQSNNNSSIERSLLYCPAEKKIVSRPISACASSHNRLVKSIADSRPISARTTHCSSGIEGPIFLQDSERTQIRSILSRDGFKTKISAFQKPEHQQDQKIKFEETENEDESQELCVEVRFLRNLSFLHTSHFPTSPLNCWDAEVSCYEYSNNQENQGAKEHFGGSSSSPTTNRSDCSSSEDNNLDNSSDFEDW